MKEKCSTAEGQQAHAMRCLGEVTVRGKMLKGLKKDDHTILCLGEVTVGGKMLEGPKKEKHVKAGLDGGASESRKMQPGEEKKAHLKTVLDSKNAARLELLHQLSDTKGGEWRIVAARPSGSGKMKRDETAKAGVKLNPPYSWCFCNSNLIGKTRVWGSLFLVPVSCQ